MIHDPFQGFADSPTAPAESCFAVIPDDLQDLPRATKALYVGTGGDVTLVALNDSGTTVFRNVAGGSILDVRARAVKLTGTTASDIVGLA